MRAVLAVIVVMAWLPAMAAPLPLYDTTRDSTQLAPLPPASTCGGLAVACSTAPDAPKHTTLPFDYGLAVSGLVGGGRGGGFSGEGVSGWIKAKDVPVSVYFDFQRFQPLGR